MTNQVQAVQQHTPGPWQIIEANADDYTPGAIVIEADGAGRDIALLQQQAEDPTDQEWANARLIAAAPEMLEALKETLRALEQHLSDEAAEHNIKHVSALCACWGNEVQRARAAIAKATHA